MLDFGNGDANLSDSLGFRFTGAQNVSSDVSVNYLASYARQVDSSHNPTNYEADYYAVEASVAKKGVGKIGAGYEVLGNDRGAFSFRTPLATLHKFNGWGDLFLTTPNDGLEDLYFLAGADFPFAL